MRRKLLVAGCTMILVAAMAGAAWAGNAIRLVVNGGAVYPEVEPQMVQGRVVAPIRAVAEALGAKVTWLPDTRTVLVDLPDVASRERQITMLERALAAQSAQQAAEDYLRAMQTRNGAWQYALLAPEVREKHKADLEGMFWVTGVSSPWLDSYTLQPGVETADGRWHFTAELYYATSTGPSGSNQLALTAQKYPEGWLLSRLAGGGGFEIGQDSGDQAVVGGRALTLKLPEGWQFANLPDMVGFKDANGAERGGVQAVGYYADQPVSSSLPNHSRELSKEDVTTALGAGWLVVLERSFPAASGRTDIYPETHAVIPVSGRTMAYDFWVIGGEADGQKDILKGILNGVK